MILYGFDQSDGQVLESFCCCAISPSPGSQSPLRCAVDESSKTEFPYSGATFGKCLGVCEVCCFGSNGELRPLKISPNLSRHGTDEQAEKNAEWR